MLRSSHSLYSELEDLGVNLAIKDRHDFTADAEIIFWLPNPDRPWIPPTAAKSELFARKYT